ncbi:sugar transferase [Geomonas limicola]|nr:sugar transferase [Geomonas limicola]
MTRNKGYKRATKSRALNEDPVLAYGLYPEKKFHEKLIQERKRAERSNKPLLVMVVDGTATGLANMGEDGSLGEGLKRCVRKTDICGLLKEGSLIGVILTEVEQDKVELAQMVVAKKVFESLANTLNEELMCQVAITFRFFPVVGSASVFDMTFYPEFLVRDIRTKGGEIAKRALDVIGGLFGLVVFSPLFVVLPILIKLSSKGPVLFMQDRVGRNGKQFKLLKFRSMYLDNDDIIHREYVTKLIKGQVTPQQGVFKIQGDPRVTPIGRYLRKYSLDELPQFINVLKGDMSLVGPRPPISYEVENYLGWQRGRLMGKRPGITGLWQVTGRSSTSFDDMVRLDLRYLSGWSIILDIQILLRTPRAVFKAKGAY